MTEFEITYKFSDVVENIKAKSKEEVEKIANNKAKDGSIHGNTELYEIEVNEIDN